MRQWFFLHIPKCAGTTFIHLLDQYFVQDEILPEHDRFLPLRGWPTEDLRRYPWIRGHFPYTEIVPRLEQPPLMFVFMRDPVELFLSHVEMRRRLFYPDEALSQRVYGKSLDEILRDDVALAYFNNFAAKMLGGTFPDAAPDEDPTRAWSEASVDINAALEHLQQFDFIGLVEEFDASLRRLERLIGLPPIQSYRKANVSPKRSRRSDLDPKTVRKIEAINALDVQLYRSACRLFAKQQEALPREESTLPQTDEVEDDLHRVYPGQGWYPGERHTRHGVIRWAGPEPEARLFYPLKPGRARWLRIEIVNWTDETLIESLHCKVNGLPVTLQRRQITWEDHSSGWVVEAKIPAEYWRPRGWQEIALLVPHTIQPPGESRQLSLCYRRVAIR